MQDLSRRKTSLKEWDLGHDHKDVSPNTEMTKDQKSYSKFSKDKNQNLKTKFCQNKSSFLFLKCI